MRLSRFRPRVSLRLFFLATFVVAAVLQTGLQVRKNYREQRREVFVADLRASVVTARKMERCFAPRMLNFIEGRIVRSPDSKLLSADEQRQLLDLVNTERVRQEVAAAEILAAQLATMRPVVPELNQFATISDAPPCPW